MQNLLKHEKVLSGNVFLQLIMMKWKDLHGLCLDAWNNYFVKMDDINYLFGKRLVVPGLYRWNVRKSFFGHGYTLVCSYPYYSR